MDKQEIFDLMARFETSSVTRMKLTWGGGCLELEKGSGLVPAATPVPPPVAVKTAGTEPGQLEGGCITAPLVGTFYVAAEPGATPFVKPGQKVKKGQTVGLLEAMKMMSEVKAPCDCVIEAILPQDGALVSYGDALVRYREG